MLEVRAGWELAAGVAALPWLRLAPKGDGHCVLVLPGLVTSDISTKLLRNFLTGRGYDVHGWGLGRNYGLRPGLEDQLLATVDRLNERSGRKISLIGHSIGGIYALKFAAKRADAVRSVITLGAPLADPRASNLRRAYKFVHGRKSTDTNSLDQTIGRPLVPTSSIYSRTDGFVPWHNSMQSAGDNSENIEVVSSHIGMAVHPGVLYIIAERLAQPEGKWQPFARRSSGTGSFSY